MRIARFLHGRRTSWGVVENNVIAVLKNHPFGRFELTGERIALSKAVLCAPACPSKIILVGLNYRDHARELKMDVPREPVIFLKPPGSLIAHRENIIYPRGVKRLDYEAELALVIKKEGRFIKEKDACDHILGYSCLNDVTARDLQKIDGQWTRAKSFDTFCPFGPWLETNIPSQELLITAYLNGKVKQASSTSNLIFAVPFLISYISRIMTLLPGDIISTGTPPGVGKMKNRDIIEIEIEGIGRLRNQVCKGTGNAAY
jgi:2-keto-4-pentenoate hydratase/2-oxohepta-3-ene-1,7-dioic acid hydratase in catechol pathway